MGLGNVWRFPYLCYRHGGGAFLVAYATMLAGTGLPLFFLELVIGQYGGIGPNKLFGRMAPAFKGLGYGMLFISFLLCINYNMIIAWSLYYLVAGLLQSPLPWQYCGHEHNTMSCYNSEMAATCNSLGDGLISYWNNSCAAVKDICSFYSLEHDEKNWDPFNFTMCLNGSDSIPLDRVSILLEENTSTMTLSIHPTLSKRLLLPMTMHHLTHTQTLLI